MKDKNIKKILIPIIIFNIISILSLYSSTSINNNNLYIKQIIWYFIGYIIMYIIYKTNINKIIKHYKILYTIGIILLILVLFTNPINNSRSWFNILNINIQPSEFMKIILIITNAYIIKKNKKNINLILKILITTLIPSILVFIEPDTGMVFIYIIISIGMLFISNINIKYFIYIMLFISLILSITLSMYFYFSDIFISIFGYKIFYRIDRLLMFINTEGYQLNNSLISISSANIFGYGIHNNPIYYPECETDFIFTLVVSNFGFIGALILIINIIYLIISLINITIKNKSETNKLISIGIIISLIYNYIQNISMTIGLMPITGITLPFISYGGSSLISSFIMISIILNLNKKRVHTNSSI